MTRTTPSSSAATDKHQRNGSLSVATRTTRVPPSQHEGVRSSKRTVNDKDIATDRPMSKREQQLNETDKEVGEVDAITANIETLLNKNYEELKSKSAELASLQLKHDKLRADFEAQGQELAKRTKRAKFLNELTSDIINKILKPYAQANGSMPEQWTNIIILDMLEALLKDANKSKATQQKEAALQKRLEDRDRTLEKEAAQASSLREKIHVLQTEMLTKVEKVQGLSDEQFASDFRSIASLVKSLSRDLRPFADKNIVEMLGCSILLEDVASHHSSGRARRKYCIEAWVWSLLMSQIFWTPFSPFGGEGLAINELYSKMFGVDFSNSMPLPTLLCETWRRTTIEHLMVYVDQDAITPWDEVMTMKVLEDAIVQTRNGAFSAIQSTFALIAPPIDLAPVRQLLDKAIAMAIQMSLQRCRLQVTYPEIGTRFDKEQMFSLPDLHGEEIDDGVVTFVVNPGLTKWGDVHGKNLELRYDIVPALVQLEAMPKVEKPEMQQERPGYADVVKDGHGGVPITKADRIGMSHSER